ncbi:MAG: phage tail sheath family protein [Gammaproteobacteria bacterium]|nr:phage tail sheath family protein [Gammaproteobacteria bacterium]
MSYFNAPGVYIKESPPPAELSLRTGVPVFIGTALTSSNTVTESGAVLLTGYHDVEQKLNAAPAGGFLSEAVRGFFANGGMQCYVLPLVNNTLTALRQGLDLLESLDDVDLVCAPDLMPENPDPTEAQRMILDHCEKVGERFAILDGINTAEMDTVIRQRQALRSHHGALYYPWIKIINKNGVVIDLPPCGQVAGVYARCDNVVGVHKAPANEPVLEGTGLSHPIDREMLTVMTQNNVNCICRYLTRRGLRVWGARTLSGSTAWKYINVKRLFMTVGRWCQKNLIGLSFETNSPRLWPRVERALTVYLTDLYLRGALQGKNPGEAFYVRCNATNNTPESRAQGKLITEIGLAATVPNEFVSVQIVHQQAGINMF